MARIVKSDVLVARYSICHERVADTPVEEFVGALIAIASVLGVLILLGMGARTPEQESKKAASEIRADIPGQTGREIAFGKVKHVIDGDTLIVAIGWRDVKIRLSSIDCPEDGQPWGDTATAGLIKLVGGRHVCCEMHDEDHYGRTVATLYVKDERGKYMNVNEKMVARGHAWVMRRYYGHLPESRRNRLNRIESWARRNRVGLWRTQNPIPPWRWRAVNRMKCKR